MNNMKKEKNKCDLNEIIIKKTVCCVVSTAVLFILLNVKLGINNVITYAYFILSFLAMISLIFTFPFLKYENEYRNKKICKVAFEISDFFTLFIIACCLIQAFFAFGFFRAEVDGPSMEKTFYNGDVIIGRSTSNVKNRDVIVLYYDEDTNPEYNEFGKTSKHCHRCSSTNLKKYKSDRLKCLDCGYIQINNLNTGDLLIKRLIASEYDTLKIEEKAINEYENELYIVVNDNYYVKCGYKINFNLDNFIGEGLTYDESKNNYVIEKGYYFVMGDNRDESLDSRRLGLFQKKHIVGCIKYQVNSLFDWKKILSLDEQDLEE